MRLNHMPDFHFTIALNIKKSRRAFQPAGLLPFVFCFFYSYPTTFTTSAAMAFARIGASPTCER